MKIVHKYILMLVLSLMTMLSFLPTPVSASTDRSSVHSFYYNPLNTNPDGSTTDNGLEYYARLSATHNTTGSKEYSSKNWDTSSAYDIYSLVENSADVYDLTNSSNLSLEGELKNTTGSDITVSLNFELPSDGSVKVDESRVAGNPVTGTYSSNFIVKFAYKGTNYTYSELQALANFSWSDVTSILFSGKLGAGEVANIDLPLVYTSSNPTTVNIRVRSYSPIRKSTWIRVRASKYMYTVDDMMTGVYVGAYSETVNGVTTYKKVPSTVQALMPTVVKSDLIYSMFNSLSQPGQQADLTQASDGVAYDHSYFLISTDRIFNAIKDEGYSTSRDSTRGLWNAYKYSMGTNLVFTDDQGNPVQFGVYDSDAQVQLSNYYVELHKVLDTKDIAITVGDKWEQFDNLTYRQSIAENGSASRTLSDS